MDSPTLDGLDFARAVVDSNRAAASLGARPGHALQVVSFPRAAWYAAEGLPSGPRALYLALWLLAHRWSRVWPPWFYRTDRWLSEEAGMSPRSLARARRDLESRRLICCSCNRGFSSPTWYGLCWPLFLPDKASPHHRAVFLAERTFGGDPPSPLQMLVQLGQVSGRDTAAVDLVVSLAGGGQGLVPREALAAQLREADPWLGLQLRWAAPALYLAPSAPAKQRSFDLGF